MKPKILLVEDNNCFIETVRLSIQGQGYKLITAKSLSEGLKAFNDHNGEFDCVVMDYHLPDGKGSDLAEEFYRRNPRLEILFATGDNSTETLMDLLDKGGASFILKGTTAILEKIKSAIASFRRDRMLLKPVLDVDDLSKIEIDLKSVGIVSKSKAMHDVYQKILKVREVPVDVLICGETGVGKELVARSIVGDKKIPFISINCAKYSSNDQFIEKDLFGCVKGAYTGANSDTRGAFEEAANGFVFLDEIHHLSFNAQGVLLRALQDKKFRRMGDNSGREINLNCRLIFGGKANLFELAQKNLFLPDLFYRIDKNQILIPPLRERTEDIEPLVRHFTDVYSKKYNKKTYIKSCSLELLESLSWNGNIRDLENLVSDLIVEHGDTEIIYSAQVKDYLEKKGKLQKISEDTQIPSADFKILSDSFSQNYIIKALGSSRTKTEAAEKLKMKRTTLLSRCEKLGINPDQFLMKDAVVS